MASAPFSTADFMASAVPAGARISGRLSVFFNVRRFSAEIIVRRELVYRLPSGICLLAALLVTGCSSPGGQVVGENIVQIELGYSNVFLIKTPRPILIDSGAPGDEDALRAALAANGVKLED